MRLTNERRVGVESCQTEVRIVIFQNWYRDIGRGHTQLRPAVRELIAVVS